MPQLELLDALASWFQEEIDSLSNVDVVSTFGQTEDDRPKRAAWVGIERAGRVGELLVWDSGEAELNAGLEGRPEISEHHDVGSVDELRRLYDRLLLFVDLSSW